MTKLDFIDKTLDIKDLPDFTVVSTFAGCGGSSTGYVWAGGKVLLAIEIDNNAVETYRLNYPKTPIYHGDIAKLTVDECLDRIGMQPGELDILDGSPPCQGFSTAGKRNFYDTRNQLFNEYVRLLRGLKPKVFIMENVPGMIKGKMKLIFAEIMRELKAIGYRVSCKKLNAMYFGVPQSRERLIFVGVRDDLGIEPSHPKAQTRPIAAPCFDKRAANYSHKRYGDVLIKGERPARTLAKLQRMFWDTGHEFGIESYRACGSYPSIYKFIGSFQDKKSRIGNSVPPRFMQAIAEHVRDEILVKVTA